MNPKEILVIDDSRDYLNFFETSVRRLAENVNISLFSCIEDAKAWLLKNACDLVFCDINFNPADESDRSGLEFLAWFRNKHRNIPVFMMTRYIDKGFNKEALKLGATGFLKKPIRLDQIKEIIRNNF